MKKLLSTLVFLLVISACDDNIPPPFQMFNSGDRVRLKADPRYNNGIIYRVWCNQFNCFYYVRFGLYESNSMRDFELEKIIQ